MNTMDITKYSENKHILEVTTFIRLSVLKYMYMKAII